MFEINYFSYGYDHNSYDVGGTRAISPTSTHHRQSHSESKATHIVQSDTAEKKICLYN